ncbi:hypothetical protein [[Phormidium] sp. ETS-05]|uniref:hypothetical protein n=1 Tax=[Phormidium] sp. ETS-05 TaxID=222819 RepID=UPI0018EF0868|nr:hypothetical protein [[Phormidium] sp. ETS-05]
MTLSLKLAVTLKGALVVVAEADDNVTVGAILSKVRVKAVAAVLMLFPASLATPVGTLTVTVPWLVG